MALVRKEEGAKETRRGQSRGGGPPLGKWQLWGWVSVALGLCYPQSWEGGFWEGQGDKLERGPEEVLGRHSKPDAFRVCMFEPLEQWVS